jgi:hypothetical protein
LEHLSGLGKSYSEGQNVEAQIPQRKPPCRWLMHVYRSWDVWRRQRKRETTSNFNYMINLETNVFYYGPSSISARFKTYFRWWCYRKWRQSHHRKYVLCMRNRFPLFFFYNRWNMSLDQANYIFEIICPKKLSKLYKFAFYQFNYTYTYINKVVIFTFFW